LQSCTNTYDQFFPFLHRFYAHPFPLYFLDASNMGTSHSFHLNLVHTWGSFERSVICNISFSCFSFYWSSPPFLCFSLIGKWYAHS
jgi:hypothetical protein